LAGITDDERQLPQFTEPGFLTLSRIRHDAIMDVTPNGRSSV
jgi:hypothetical protein